MTARIGGWICALGASIGSAIGASGRFVFTQTGYLTITATTDVLLDSAGNKFTYVQR